MTSPPRPVLFDLTHLIARLRAPSATGIDRIDLAFAAHFLAQGAQASRYGPTAPRLLRPQAAQRFARAAETAWRDAETAQAQALRDWLADGGRAPRSDARAPKASWPRRLLSWSGYAQGSARRAAPQGAIYLNVGAHRFEHPRFFSWLAERPDVAGAFMIHDLLPLDYPEYFDPGESDKGRARLATALRYGRAFLVSTQAVRRRLEREIAAQGLPPRPIWAQPFPSPLADLKPLSPPPRRPYFVAVGTLEPRKNHLLLLQIWRDLALRMETPPALVLVGARGWGAAQALALLDRCEPLAGCVAEVANLGAPELAELIGGARALLAPSFDEGYGLPIVEALSLGTPVIAADFEAAREVGQGRARLLSPLDGEGWRREILTRLENPGRETGFAAPNWPDYFASLEGFLAAL